MIRKQDMIYIWEVKNIDVLPRANDSERPLSPTIIHLQKLFRSFLENPVIQK